MQNLAQIFESKIMGKVTLYWHHLARQSMSYHRLSLLCISGKYNLRSTSSMFEQMKRILAALYLIHSCPKALLIIILQYPKRQIQHTAEDNK